MPRRGDIRFNFDPTELYRLYVDELMSSYDIADRYGCSPTTVFAALEQHGISVRKKGNAARGKPQRFNIPIIESSYYYIVERWSLEQVAMRFGCTTPTIASRFRKAGVKIRASNDTKRGAPSPHRAIFDEDAAVSAYVTETSLSISELAERFDVQKSAIYRVLAERDIETKPLSQVIRDKRNGSANPNWRPDLTDEERSRVRENAKTVRWRKAVFERDRFTCVACEDDTGGNLNAHHLESYNSRRDLRWEVSNGATLCETCHGAFHKRYGYGYNTAEQFHEWLTNQGIIFVISGRPAAMAHR